VKPTAASTTTRGQVHDWASTEVAVQPVDAVKGEGSKSGGVGTVVVEETAQDHRYSIRRRSLSPSRPTVLHFLLPLLPLFFFRSHTNSAFITRHIARFLNCLSAFPRLRPIFD
jgi:hypothetical protein